MQAQMFAMVINAIRDGLDELHSLYELINLKEEKPIKRVWLKDGHYPVHKTGWKYASSLLVTINNN